MAHLRILALSLTLLGGTMPVAAQTPAPPVPPASLEALIAEVRQLRAQVAQASDASMRLQLLVARLSLEEQRLASLGRQSADVQKQWAAVVQDRSQAEAALKQLQGAMPPASEPTDRKNEFNPLDIFKLKIAQQRQQEEQLRAQDAELSSAIASEQNRWIDLNARLDDLERSLAAASSGR